MKATNTATQEAQVRDKQKKAEKRKAVNVRLTSARLSKG